MNKKNGRMTFRHEKVLLSGIPEALRGVSLLFLTDPHIGGDIDRRIHKISTGLDAFLSLHQTDKMFVCHGGDFMSSVWHKKEKLSFEHFVQKSEILYSSLVGMRHFGVIGNHDVENPEFVYSKGWLEEKLGMHFMSESRHAKKIYFEEYSLCIHGIHTLRSHLCEMSPRERDMILDQYIYMLNHTHNAMNVVLMHNPDGLDFLLERLVITGQSIAVPTLFLAGHTHGGLFNLPLVKRICLRICGTLKGRYRGWYGPEGAYQNTGNWAMFVSTGMGNNPGCSLRIKADPEVVMFTL